MHSSYTNRRGDEKSLRIISKVKRGNLERKLDFGTCCSRKICSKSETMFVWEAHLSTVKAGKSCLTLLLYLRRTADQLLRVQKLVGWVTWNTSCLDISNCHTARKPWKYKY